MHLFTYVRAFEFLSAAEVCYFPPFSNDETEIERGALGHEMGGQWTGEHPGPRSASALKSQTLTTPSLHARKTHNGFVFFILFPCTFF